LAVGRTTVADTPDSLRHFIAPVDCSMFVGGARTKPRSRGAGLAAAKDTGDEMTITMLWISTLVAGALGAAGIARAAEAAKALRPIRVPARRK
jgi:hypothetical protein